MLIEEGGAATVCVRWSILIVIVMARARQASEKREEEFNRRPNLQWNPHLRGGTF